MIRSGSICISLLYNYLTTEITTMVKGGDTRCEYEKRLTKLDMFADVFANYGGILSKLSQLICYSDNSKTNHNVFSDCKPFNEEKTRQYFIEQIKNNPDRFHDLSDIDFEIYKSGSVGQVHRAIYKDDTEVVIKVQYVGLKEQFKSDFILLEKVSYFLFGSDNFDEALAEVNLKLHEELDYRNEARNQEMFLSIWKDVPYIQVPKIYNDISDDKILCMEYINGECLSKFIENSTQEERDDIGWKLFEFTFTNLYDNKIFYSDMHYGNFLIKDKSIVYVMDFGCTHKIESDDVMKLKELHRSIFLKDKLSFLEIIRDLGIINEATSVESLDYAFDYFTLQIEPWCSNNFCFTDEWLYKATRKEVGLMKEWHLPANLVFISKIPYGLFHVLNKMKVTGNFLDFFKSRIELEA